MRVKGGTFWNQLCIASTGRLEVTGTNPRAFDALVLPLPEHKEQWH